MTKILALGLMAVLAVGLGVLTFHYRQQSEYYRQQWENALSDPELDTPLPVKPSSTRVVTVKAVAPPVADVTVLQTRIGELERQLAGKEAMIASLRQSVAGRTADNPAKMSEPSVFLSRRTNDVVRQAEFEKQRKESQQKVQNAFARKAAFLLKRDTSKLSEEEKKQYEQMVGLLDETWKMTAQMQSNLSGEQRHQVMHAVRDNITALDPLLTSERNREFYDLGLSLGYNEDEAVQFVSYLTEVIDVTSVSSLFPHFRGRTSPRKN